MYKHYDTNEQSYVCAFYEMKIRWGETNPNKNDKKSKNAYGTENNVALLGYLLLFISFCHVFFSIYRVT